MVKGLTQRQLAQELGVDPTTVLKWEAAVSQPMEKTRKRVEQLICLTGHHFRGFEDAEPFLKTEHGSSPFERSQ